VAKAIKINKNPRLDFRFFLVLLKFGFDEITIIKMAMINQINARKATPGRLSIANKLIIIF